MNNLDKFPLAKIISERYTVRQFAQGKTIPADILDQIVSAGVQAPTAKNGQPFHFYLIESEETKSKLFECYSRPGFSNASSFILIVGEDEQAWTYKDGMGTSLYTDAAIATAYMQLQAWELGISSVWVCAFDREKCCELFGFELGKRSPISILALGYPVEGFERVPRKRKPVDELLTKL